jgi:ubiquinone/menaquinone biosynthesis C-methylase UbiE
MGDVRSWTEMAVWFDARQGDEGDRWHRELIYPCVKRMAGDVAGLRVLDLACGNGSLSRWLKRQGAEVVGADGTLALLDCAGRRETESPLGTEFIHCDAARLEFARANEFDLVTCTMALMDMPDAQATNAIAEIARVIKPDGRALICISHPCFDVPENSEWIVDRSESARRKYGEKCGDIAKSSPARSHGRSASFLAAVITVRFNGIFEDSGKLDLASPHSKSQALPKR